MQVDVNDGHISGPPGQGPQSVADTGGGADSGVAVHLGAAEEPPIHPRLLAMIVAGRYHGLELDPSDFRGTPGDASPSAAALSSWAQGTGMWSRAVRLRWRHLMRFHNTGPVVLLFTDGTAGLLTGINTEHKVAFIKDPTSPASRSAGTGGRTAAERSVGRRGGAAARQPRLCGNRRAVLAALAVRPRAAGEALAARDRCRFVRVEHFDHLPALPDHDRGRQGADPPLLFDPGADRGHRLHRHPLRDVARLCAAAGRARGRRQDRRQDQPARVQSPVAPAARLLRAASGRRDDVQHRPDPPGARVHHRQAAGCVPRSDDARGAAAIPVLAERGHGLDGAGLRVPDRHRDPGVPEAAGHDLRPRGRRGDRQAGGAGRDRVRGAHREVAGDRTAAQGAVGRADRRGRQVAPGLRQAGQLAADTGDADRALHVDGRDPAGRLLGAERIPPAPAPVHCSRS